ncbi:MAG: hypothetical protein ACLFSE_13065 [Spirochaetia bacterium]
MVTAGVSQTTVTFTYIQGSGTYHSGSMLSGAVNGEVRVKSDRWIVFTAGGGYRSPRVTLSGEGIVPGESGADSYFSGKILFSEIDSLSYVFSIRSYPYYWKYSHL